MKREDIEKALQAKNLTHAQREWLHNQLKKTEEPTRKMREYSEDYYNELFDSHPIYRESIIRKICRMFPGAHVTHVNKRRII